MQECKSKHTHSKLTMDSIKYKMVKYRSLLNCSGGIETIASLKHWKQSGSNKNERLASLKVWSR